MSKQAVINLKTDSELKVKAAQTAEKLGVSLSAVLNNELRRFATEQTVSFEIPEVPNTATAKRLAQSQKERDAGDYHRFDSNEAALDYLANVLK